MNEGENKPSRWERFGREIRIEIVSLRRLLAIAAGRFGARRAGGINSVGFSDSAWYLGNSNAFEGYQGDRRIGGKQ
jgi:hypothetical protein